MPSVADLRAARRRTVLIGYTANSTQDHEWGYATSPGPTAAGSGAGYNPTEYLPELPALVSDAYLIGHNFRSSGDRPVGRMVDLLWVGPALAMSALGTTTLGSGTLPARDRNGATDGDGVMLGLFQSSAGGSGSWAATASYTNEAGVSGRTATQGGGNDTGGQFRTWALAAGDAGVRSVESITITDATTNVTTWIPCLYRRLSTRREPFYRPLGDSRRPSALGDMPLMKAGTVLMPLYYYFGNVSAVRALHELTLAEV